MLMPANNIHQQSELRWPGNTPERVSGQRAFTLLEMLIVLVIIAILAGLALPHIRGNTESVAINAACRQLVADLSLARQRAISQRSTVAVVFISPDIFNINLGGWGPNELEEIKRLQGGVYTHYALYQYRKVGEQPGTRDSEGYITEWKSLPDKTFIDPNEFTKDRLNLNQSAGFRVHPGNVQPQFRFPFSSSPPLQIGPNGLPYIAFDHEGRCITVDRDETGVGTMAGDRYLNVARGAILFTRESDGRVLESNYEAQQVPPFNATNNIIYVNALTGRAKRQELQLQ
jgi:prepilin-type N-terminal cleavage/methylation domain-containing protein